jgi:hypothetical protein
MNAKIKYWDIFKRKVDEMFKSNDLKHSDVGYAKASIFLLPFILLISFFEYLWKLFFYKENR